MAKGFDPLGFVNKYVGPWLGGSSIDRPSDTKIKAGVGASLGAVDALAGGYGSAVLKDSIALSQGGYLPKNILKTTAINAASATAAAGAAKVVGGYLANRAISKSAEMKNLMAAKEALEVKNPKNVIFHASGYGTYGTKPIPGAPDYVPVHLRGVITSKNPIPLGKTATAKPGTKVVYKPNVHMGTKEAAWDRVSAGESPWFGASVDRYEIVDPSSVASSYRGKKFIDEDWYKATGTSTEGGQSIQAYDMRPIPGQKIASYKNMIEDPGSTSYLVPKTRILGEKVVVAYGGQGKGGYVDLIKPVDVPQAVVYRGSADIPPITGKRSDTITRYTSPISGKQLDARSLRGEVMGNLDFTTPKVISARNAVTAKNKALDAAINRAAKQAAALGFVAPKPKGKNGGRRR